MLDKINSIVLKILKPIIVLVFFIFIYYFSLAVEGAGDEFVFLNDLNFIHSNGWFAALAHKISPTYLLLAYPFSFIIKNYLALRLVNFILLGLLFYYFKKYGNIQNNMFYFYFLFYSTTNWVFLGTNDSLFITALVIFFTEVYKFFDTNIQPENSLLYCAIILAFFTRELIYVYAPVIAFSFFLLYKNSYNFALNIRTPIILTCALIVLNIPSLLTNHQLSYDNKIPPSNVKSSWSQRQYLAQLMVNNGTLPYGSHPSWQQTDLYLEKNGFNSLPNSLLESVLFDLKLTVKEFFKNFASVIFLSIRQLGLIIPLSILFLFISIYKKQLDYLLYLPFILFLMIAILSFIIISYVETRWLVPVFIMAIFFYSNLEIKYKLPKTIFLLNNLVFLFALLYGTYRVILKF